MPTRDDTNDDPAHRSFQSPSGAMIKHRRQHFVKCLQSYSGVFELLCFPQVM